MTALAKRGDFESLDYYHLLERWKLHLDGNRIIEVVRQTGRSVAEVCPLRQHARRQTEAFQIAELSREYRDYADTSLKEAYSTMIAIS